MVLFKNVVEIFDLKNFDQFACTGDLQDVVDSLRSHQIGSTFINDYFVWNTIACYGFLKETPCSTEISPLGEHEIERLPVTINSPI